LKQESWPGTPEPSEEKRPPLSSFLKDQQQGTPADTGGFTRGFDLAESCRLSHALAPGIGYWLRNHRLSARVCEVGTHKDSPMHATRFAGLALTALLLSATAAAAQLPPPLATAPVPQLNPSSSLVLQGPGQVPVNPGAGPGSVAVYGNNLAGTNQVVNPHRTVFAYHGRRHHQAHRFQHPGGTGSFPNCLTCQ
jgi:hypothetical protein